MLKRLVYEVQETFFLLGETSKVIIKYQQRLP